MRFTDKEFAEYRLLRNDILLNEGQSLELVGRCAMYDGKPEDCCFQNTLVRYRCDGQADPKYMLALFRHLQVSGGFARIASQTTSIAHLGVSRFAALKVPKPPLDEQRRIVAVLSAWDRAIEVMERLVALKTRRKRALMQQLLTGKRRFPEFVRLRKTADSLLGEVATDWPLRPIGKVFRRVKRKNGTTTDVVLTASGQHGLVDQREYFNRNVAGVSLAGYYLLKHGEFAYNRSAMKGYPYGAIKRLDLHEHGAVSTLYHCFALADKHSDADFFMHLFELGLLNRQLRRICQVGGRAHGLLNVTAGDFEKMVVPVPEKEEQQRIAAVLHTCDEEIANLTAQLDALKQQKKGLMQKLLTGDVRVPEKETE